MDIRRTVLAVAEHATEGPTSTGLAALAAAERLAEGLGWSVAVAVAAPRESDAGAAWIERGAHAAFQFCPEAGAPTSRGAYLEAVWLLVQELSAGAVIFPEGRWGREAAARVAARMGCGLVSGCTSLEVDGDVVRLGAPSLDGRAFAQFEWQAPPPQVGILGRSTTFWMPVPLSFWDPARSLVVTVGAGAFPQPRARVEPGARVVKRRLHPYAGTVGVVVLDEVSPRPEDLDVTEADVLVAGGAGVDGPEGFAQLAELAGWLGGTVAASRAAVDLGWAEPGRQVGQTGKTVSPRLYLAAGISGAPQHLAGIRSADALVAINRDPDAPICREADLAVIADLREVLPALLARLAKRGTAAARGRGRSA